MTVKMIGDTPLELRFNIVTKILTKAKMNRAIVEDFIHNLPPPIPDDEIEHHAAGFRPVKLTPFKKPRDFEKEIISQLLPFEFERKYLGKQGLVIQQALIFWILPDISVFCGEKNAVMRAYQRFQHEFRKTVSDMRLQLPDFEWYYFLKQFEMLQRKKVWLKGEREGEPPPTDIAKGVSIDSIHDVDTEWERESDQAKKIIAKKAGDSTEDLATIVSILQGRMLRSMVINVSMENEQRLVRLSMGGRIFVRRKQLTPKPVRKKRRRPKKREDVVGEETKRIVWGLEFARRVLKAYEKWRSSPVDKRLPSDDVYKIIDKKVDALIKPVLQYDLRARLQTLKKLRNELKSQEALLDKED